MLKSELNCHDRSNMLLFITKSKQDNDVIDRIGVIFIEYNTKMSILIEQCAVYDEDETEQ